MLNIGWNAFEDKVIKDWQKIRSYIYTPILKFLHKLGLTPTLITNIRVLLMVGFFYFLRKDLLTSAIFYFIALFLDTIDGALARFKKTFSDRGKFLDIFADHLIFSLFLLGLFILGIANSFLILYAVFITPILYLLAVIKKQEGKKTDWIIKPMAKIAYFKTAVNIVFFVYVLFDLNYLDYTLIAANIIMTLLCLLYYVQIQLRWKKWLVGK